MTIFNDYMINGNILVSMLIPVYNSSEFLEKCLKSIIKQSYRNIEVILVNDGSTDDSCLICEKFCKIDKRFRLYNQKRSGVVVARKTAVSKASGTYVLCVDSDDFLELDMVEQLVKYILMYEADVVCSGYIKEKIDGGHERENHIRSGLYRGNSLKDFYSKMIYSGKFYQPGITPFVWNKLIKMDLYRKYQTMVPNKINKGEDAAVIYPLLLEAKSIVIVNELKPYHYRKNSKSICHTSDDLFYDRLKILIDYLEQNIKCTTLRKQLQFYKLYSIYNNEKYQVKKAL